MNIVKHIPNTITSMNLLCGVIGVICTFGGRFDIAFYMILGAAVFDFCDGLSARALNAYSELGKQLDSLSDMVSFGVLPAMILYRLMAELSGESLLNFSPLGIAVFSGLRLAKFNIDERQSENFIGLATPSCAILCGALAHYIYCTPDSFLTAWASGKIFIPVLSVCLSALLVSEISMFSLKFKKGQQKDSIVYKQRVCFIGLCIATAIIVFLFGQKFSIVFILATIIYIIMNIINYFVRGRQQ